MLHPHKLPLRLARGSIKAPGTRQGTTGRTENRVAGQTGTPERWRHTGLILFHKAKDLFMRESWQRYLCQIGTGRYCRGGCAGQSPSAPYPVTILRVCRLHQSASSDDATNKGVNRMTHQKTLDILSTGKTLWNKWRREHAEIQAFEPDLHGADLHGADLHGMDFHEADLTEANLQDADLREADLRETDLRHADLRSANLSDAHLLRARLHGADVRGATLCRTNLKRADLSNADLRGADLDGAILDKANFYKANVSRRDLGEADSNTLLKAKEQRTGSVALQDVKAA